MNDRTNVKLAVRFLENHHIPVISKCVNLECNKKAGCLYNSKLRFILTTIVGVEKHQVLHIMRLCL